MPAAALALGVLVAVCHALENTTSALSGPPVAAAVRSHFNECPDSHSQFCFHGTCRFLVQEDKPACHSGYVGTRCEHADLLAVVAANQKKQTITALVVVAVVASVVLIAVCVLIHHLPASLAQLLPAAEALRVLPGTPLRPGEAGRAPEGQRVLLPRRDGRLTQPELPQPSQDAAPGMDIASFLRFPPPFFFPPFLFFLFSFFFSPPHRGGWQRAPRRARVPPEVTAAGELTRRALAAEELPVPPSASQCPPLHSTIQLPLPSPPPELSAQSAGNGGKRPKILPAAEPAPGKLHLCLLVGFVFFFSLQMLFFFSFFFNQKAKREPKPSRARGHWVYFSTSVPAGKKKKKKCRRALSSAILQSPNAARTFGDRSALFRTNKNEP
ncbi:protransforming growth factor alpha isoform X2 [Anser cygnoides]|uniref:protransforming growth factor alpha isoform X2 n=1 Tax=Anser cygnoides TaxID=8845 RepID=UPI0034D2E7C8